MHQGGNGFIARRIAMGMQRPDDGIRMARVPMLRWFSPTGPEAVPGVGGIGEDFIDAAPR